MDLPPTILADFYKISHRAQYPVGTDYVYSTWTPRASRLDGVNEVIAFGFQAFVMDVLINFFNNRFFGQPKSVVIDEYQRVIKYTLGEEYADASHIADLHDLGYLPIKIKAVPEGTRVPIRVPMLTIENTEPGFFWLTNYLETLMSLYLWKPATSATIAAEYRKLLDKYAEETGGDVDFVPLQAHDFSMRGSDSLTSCAASGAGHLLSFIGTDTIPAISYLEQFYGADIENEMVGTSIPATEHSVMCAHGQDELESYRYLITEVYPSGFVSIVSDTWDLWGVLSNVIAELKDEILSRDGKVVIRPDSGDPVKIICGDPDSDNELARKGVIEVLWDIFGGTVENGFKSLDPHIGAIYGDAITLDRCRQICEQLASKGFASTNVVFGIGSYTYHYNTRDTFGFALKSTHVVVNGEERAIYKAPVTDNGTKYSQRGRVVVIEGAAGLEYMDGLTVAEQQSHADVDVLKTVFKDGLIENFQPLSTVRMKVAQ